MFESGQKQLLMKEEVAYGNTLLEFTIRHSARKTMAIEVHPDQTIRVVAPLNSSLEDIKERVLKKGKWIVKQQSFFEQFLPRTPEREFISGESHFYLGRKYLLKLRKSTKHQVKLKGRELIVYLSDATNKEMVKRLLGRWYYNHAKKRFDQSINDSVKKFNKYKLSEVPPLIVKRMNKRWGSCTLDRKIILNPEIIKTPSKCIEYVVTHELCHLIHPNHSKEFYQLQTEIMPDWKKWKLRLEKTLI